jgi:ADP-heptose:LPS heptosyltransferase
VSNPDNIGDVVLRQPMFAALSGAGHELLLAVRSFVAPIAPLVAPKARIVVLESDPYTPDFNPASDDVRRAVEAAREFAPKIYCIAPYQRTEFDELLAESLNGCCTVGMTGVLFPGVIEAGLNRQSRIRLDLEVPVSIDQHEFEKNELLCGKLLGRPVKLPDPAIRAGRSQIEPARSVIGRLGLEPGKFWIVCVGCNRYTAVKNWTPENWAKVLSHAVVRYGQKVLMVGTPDESAATEQIRNLMGPNADATENLCDAPQPLATLVGLLHHSAGYLGRDTGPMHLAAALGKPVIAVFGGGHWPRFIPRAKVGAVATVVMPCSGCDWACHLRESYCVKRVPVEAILDAFDSIQNKSLKGLRLQQLQLDPVLSARIIRESSVSCRDLRRRLAAAELPQPMLAQLRSELETSSRAAAELHRTQQAMAELSDRLADSTREIALVRASADRLAQQLALMKAERDHLEGQVRSERIKAQSARRDAEKIQEQAAAERQSILDVLNDLVIEHAALKQTADQEAREAREAAEAIRQRDHAIGDYQQQLNDVTAMLKDVRESISFRVGSTAGRPVVALLRMLRSLVSRSEETH